MKSKRFASTRVTPRAKSVAQTIYLTKGEKEIEKLNKQLREETRKKRATEKREPVKVPRPEFRTYEAGPPLADKHQGPPVPTPPPPTTPPVLPPLRVPRGIPPPATTPVVRTPVESQVPRSPYTPRTPTGEENRFELIREERHTPDYYNKMNVNVAPPPPTTDPRYIGSIALPRDTIILPSALGSPTIFNEQQARMLGDETISRLIRRSVRQYENRGTPIQLPAPLSTEVQANQAQIVPRPAPIDPDIPAPINPATIQIRRRQEPAQITEVATRRRGPPQPSYGPAVSDEYLQNIRNNNEYIYPESLRWVQPSGKKKRTPIPMALKIKRKEFQEKGISKRKK